MQSNLPLPPQTPARRVANRLVDQLRQQTVLASPGPRLYISDGDDSDSAESVPVVAAPRRRPPGRLRTQLPALQITPESGELSLNSDDDEPSAPSQAAPAGRRRRTAEPTGIADADGYVWTDAAALSAADASADAQYFFGKHSLDKGFKCRICG